MDFSKWSMPLITVLKTTFSLVKIMTKMEKYLNVNENILCNDFGDGQSAKKALTLVLCS